MFALGRFIPIRNLLRPTDRDDTTPADGAGSLFSVSSSDVLRSLRAEGIYAGLILPVETVAEIAAFAQGSKCYANFDRHYSFMPGEYEEAVRQFGRPILTGHYLERV